MRPSRVGRKVDSNHHAIKEGLEARGFVVISTAAEGNGAPDLWVTAARWGGWWKPLEVKRAGPPSARKLKPAQAKREARVKIPVVQSIGEALNAIGVYE